MAALLVYLCFAYVAVLVFFHPLHRPRIDRDLILYLVYFAGFFVFFLLIPISLTRIIQGLPWSHLREVGLGIGNIKRGLPIAVVGIPLAVLSGRVGSKDKSLANFYPFSRQALRSRGNFILFEMAYILLYYPAWEFLYRGILLFPFIPVLGLVPALALQTMLSTLYHIGHPPSEIMAAVAAGFLFGFIAYWTGSLFYPVLLHAAAGVSTDCFLYRRAREKRTA